MAKKKYNLAYLLKKQPQKIKKNPQFVELVNLLKSSDSLKKLKFNRNTYSALNHVRVNPGDLKGFIYNNRFQENPFFPLFLKLKKEYLSAKLKKKKDKQDYIYIKLKQLSPQIKKYLKVFRDYECSRNKRFPLWKKFFYPKTKKRVNELSKYSTIEWAGLFNTYTDEVYKRYKQVDLKYLNKIISLFVLELEPQKYKITSVKIQYRKLSKKYHPDSGGNNHFFNLLQKSRDILLD